MEGADLAGKILSTWLTLVLGLILLPSAFGVSLGISEIYMKILVKTLEQRGKQHLYIFCRAGGIQAEITGPSYFPRLKIEPLYLNSINSYFTD